MWTSVCIYRSLACEDKRRCQPYMLIGQWVDKDSTISLCNEPLHRRSTASEEGEREVTQRNYEICLDVCELCVVVSADWTLSIGICAWTHTTCCSRNVHLLVEPVSAKVCFCFCLFFNEKKKKMCFSWMTLHFGHYPKGLVRGSWA